MRPSLFLLVMVLWGKTSLVKRLVNDIFDDQERKTPGIKITNWLVPINGGDDIRLNIWDFGGQEIMHSTHQFFLTQGVFTSLF